MSKRPMLPIPISAAKKIAEQYGYDQVVIIARRVGQAPEPYGEHVTTYGVDREHCRSAALQGDALKKFMGWPAQELKHGPDCECGCRTDPFWKQNVWQMWRSKSFDRLTVQAS